MAKLRLSPHCLRIETGRHENLPIKDRICLRCESEIDDEVHFLITCPCFKTERTLFFSNNNLLFLTSMVKLLKFFYTVVKQ